VQKTIVANFPAEYERATKESGRKNSDWGSAGSGDNGR
jgi:hypothetical protein